MTKRDSVENSGGTHKNWISFYLMGMNRNNLAKLLDIDLTKHPYIIFLIFILIISRVPLLNMGFGSDEDAWSAANSAFRLLETGVYNPSRGFGYPFHELLTAFILKIDEITINNGWLLSNISTMFSSLICVILFGRILSQAEVKNKGLLVLTFAFMPIIWKNSTVTMDYMWALMFIMLGWYLITVKRYRFSAIALVFAVSARYTSVLMLAPFLYLIYTERRYKEMIVFSLIAAVFPFFIYLPILYTNGLNILSTPSYYYNLTDVLRIGYLLLHQFLGVDAALFLIVISIFHIKSVKNILIDKKDKDRIIYFTIIVIILFSLAFFKAPLEAEYLIPIIPFGLIFINKLIKRQLMVIFCILIVLNGFLSIPELGYTMTPKKIEPKIDIFGAGYFLNDVESRQRFVDIKDIKINNHSVVVWWKYQPAFYFHNRYKILNNSEMLYLSNKSVIYDLEHDVYYYYLIGSEIDLLSKKGYRLYIVDDTIRRNYDYGINLSEYSPVPIRFR